MKEDNGSLGRSQVYTTLRTLFEQESVSVNALNHEVSQRVTKSLGRASIPRPTAYKGQP